MQKKLGTTRLKFLAPQVCNLLVETLAGKITLAMKHFSVFHKKFIREMGALEKKQ